MGRYHGISGSFFRQYYVLECKPKRSRKNRACGFLERTLSAPQAKILGIRMEIIIKSCLFARRRRDFLLLLLLGLFTENCEENPIDNVGSYHRSSHRGFRVFSEKPSNYAVFHFYAKKPSNFFQNKTA